MKKQNIQISDLYRFKLVSDPQISPDGSRVVFVVERMDKKEKKYFSNLALVSTKGRRVQTLTVGKKEDRLPRWSPDGKSVAFVSNRPAQIGGKSGEEKWTQIWILPMEGGEAKPLTRLPRGKITELKWSPDGKEIGFLFHPTGKEVVFDKSGKPEIPTYRYIKELWYRLDGEGFLDSEFTHLWIADTRTGVTRQLVTGNWYDRFFDWSPDGKEIVFISNRKKDWHYHLEEDDLFLVRAKGGTPRKISTPAGPKVGVSFSPDGRTLVFIGHTRPYEGWGVVNFTIRTVRKNGKEYKNLTDSLDRTAFSVTVGDLTPSFVVTSPVWDKAGRWIYFLASSQGGSPLYRVSSDTGIIETVTEKKVVVSFSFDKERENVVFHGGQIESLDELFLVSIESNDLRQITNMNRYYVNSRQFNIPEEIGFKSGRTNIQGWILTPPDFSGKHSKYPLILQIHGGPRCQYAKLFFHEMQVLAANGYVVMYTNPRGSQGYGERFADAITGKWADPAMKDLMAAVDYAISLGYVDEKRMGVTGGSYGGYMTNWVVTHSDRFKAAVTQRSVSNLASMFGTSDFGFDMDWEFKATPWDNPDLYAKWSPITYIKRCKTPLLIFHSEHDWRCNVEQDDQMFMALKFLKREVEYIRFPEEPHGLSRHGRPDRREARLKLMLDWFNRFLK